jgi:hypothetical protein
MLRVLLDTNALCADYYLRGTSARLLLDSGKRQDIQVLVPMVAFLEAIRKFGEDTQGLIKDMGGWRNRLSRVAPSVGPFDSLRASLGMQVDNYEQLLTRVLLDSRAVLLPIPEIPHERVLERILSRRKPVKTDGRGYQDVLIWESILAEFPTDSNPVYFITNNWTDFAVAADGDDLAPELIEDLRSIGSTEKAVRLYRRLNQFTDIHLKPQREILGPSTVPIPHASISEDSLKETLSSFLEDYADKLVGSSVDSYNGPIDLEDLEIADASYTGDLTIHEAFLISTEEVGISGEAEFDAELSALIRIANDPSARRVTVSPVHEDTHWQSVVLRATLEVEFEGTIDQTQEEVIEFRPSNSSADIMKGMELQTSATQVHPDQGKLWE